MTRLLNKPLKVFTVFAVIILACSIPAYFFLVESIWIDELDDHNEEIKHQISQGFSGLSPDEVESSITLWNRVHPESKINPVDQPQTDSVYTIEKERIDNGTLELERFRGYLSSLELNGKLYNIRVETNVEEVHETVLAISKITCVFITILILGFVLLNRQLSKKIWKPFTDTLEKLRKFDLNSATKVDFAKTDIIEFAELNETLEKLIESNIKVFKQQKEFAQNASHELQTPLALLKTKLDLLIQSPSLNAEQRSIIESLDNSVSRITRINKNLLLLARIENRVYEATTVNLSGIVQTSVDVFRGFPEKNGKDIITNCETGVHVNANESLAEIMVNNLLSNAIRHGSDTSPISLDLNNNSISVMNGGNPALNAESLFKRFISVDSQSQGTGLGLAIVKEICDKYGWKVSYSHKEGQHIFSVEF